MFVDIYLLCYNEESLLPHTVKFYRERFPDCKITILDNESIDASIIIANDLNCEIHTWSTDDTTNNRVMMSLKNNFWKSRQKQCRWVIMCDMDEWLEVDVDRLTKEELAGTTVLLTQGYNIISKTESFDLELLFF